MSSDDLDATDHVHALADADAISMAIADRLDENGFETIADLLIAERDDLEDVPYVGGQRADEILTAVDAVVSPEPREVDLEATESVVSEAAIPLSVRRGEMVLIGGQHSDYYHTTKCSVVSGSDFRVRDREAIESSTRALCQSCQEPGVHVQNGAGARQESELETLVNPREVILEATLGEKLDITMADRVGYADPFAVIDVEPATEWEAPTGDTWYTRRLRISQKMNGDPDRSECDLVLGADEIWLEDLPVEGESSQPDLVGWRVESVGAVGRVAPHTHAQLQGKQEQTDRPEGDDSWRKYQRGEA